jgi:hypothetical protein
MKTLLQLGAIAIGIVLLCVAAVNVMESNMRETRIQGCVRAAVEYANESYTEAQAHCENGD